MEFVQYAEDDGIAIISLDRPDARNAQHPPLLRELDELSLIHISEPTRQEAISYAVFCLKKKKK